jgi:hypothetical protein
VSRTSGNAEPDSKEMQRGAQENLWPKLFSRAPRCAPLRLAFPVAASRPYCKLLKSKKSYGEGPGRNFYPARKNYVRAYILHKREHVFRVRRFRYNS